MPWCRLTFDSSRLQAATTSHTVQAAAAPRTVEPDVAGLSPDHACSVVVGLESPQ